MRRIQRIPKPEELTEDIQKELTERFKKDESDVWNQQYIRDGLLKMTDHKCCYCESKVGSGIEDLHVEHFHPKDKYPDEVVDWENLFPSCPHCNRKKSNHDTNIEPIINPCKVDPRQYFYFKNYRYRSKDLDPDSIGKRTLYVLKLNNTNRIKNTRFKIGEQLSEEIGNIYELASDNRDILCTNTRKRNKVLNGCRNLLEFCQPNSEYGSFMSTILHNDEDFIALCEILKQLDLWNDELEELFIMSNDIKYEIR